MFICYISCWKSSTQIYREETDPSSSNFSFSVSWLQDLNIFVFLSIHIYILDHLLGATIWLTFFKKYRKMRKCIIDLYIIKIKCSRSLYCFRFLIYFEFWKVLDTSLLVIHCDMSIIKNRNQRFVLLKLSIVYCFS